MACLLTRGFERQVSGQKPFGLRTFFRGTKAKKRTDDVIVLQNGGRAWAQRKEITEGIDLIDKWKVFTSKSSSEHAGQADKNGMRRVLSLTGILPPGSVVTETYVILGAYDSEIEARNCLSYCHHEILSFSCRDENFGAGPPQGRLLICAYTGLSRDLDR